MTEEEKGFIVKDHRAFADDGSTREPDKEEPEPAAQKEAGPQKQEEQAQDGPAEQSQEKESKRSLPPVDFSGLILSLSHAALLHLGQIPDPQTGQTHKDHDMARHSIDTISMLHEKTKGNLTPEEQKLTDNVLTELRLAFVRLTQ